MKTIRLILVLIFAIPHQDVQANKDLEKEKYLLKEYNLCVNKAKGGKATVHEFAQWHSFNSNEYNNLVKNVHQEIAECDKILSVGEDKKAITDISSMKQEIESLKKQIEIVASDLLFVKSFVLKKNKKGLDL